MPKGMDEKKAAAEAVLFASGEPVALSRIADALDVSQETAQELLESLRQEYDGRNSGLQIRRLERQYQMCARPSCEEAVRRALDLRRNAPLSPAAMEVLAVVAYNQPVTKAFVEQIRGVDCSGVLANLLAKGLVEERGRLELPGRPLLYGTTADFLRCMGLSSLEELPDLAGFAQEEEPLA